MISRIPFNPEHPTMAGLYHYNKRWTNSIEESIEREARLK
jgi:hypothetical protein